MENINEINRKIADNLISCRKAAGMTQAELAEKINYSDKSVSKWESGNGVPDVYTLMQIARLFNVTLNELVGDEAPTPKAEKLRNERRTRGLRFLIMLLSSCIVWLVATCVFVVLNLVMNEPRHLELCFLYALVVQSILLVVFAGIWKYRLLGFASVSTLIWMTLTCVYLTAKYVSMHIGSDYSVLWVVFLIGIPLQLLEVLWVFFRSLLRRNKKNADGGKRPKKETGKKQ